jgi:hypothetical protein
MYTLDFSDFYRNCHHVIGAFIFVRIALVHSMLIKMHKIIYEMLFYN